MINRIEDIFSKFISWTCVGLCIAFAFYLFFEVLLKQLNR